MKKCPDCHREIDRFGIACQYCGKVEEARKKEKEKEHKEPPAVLRRAKRRGDG